MKLRISTATEARRVVVRSVRGVDASKDGLGALIGEDLLDACGVGDSFIEMSICPEDASLIYVHVEGESGYEGTVVEPFEDERTILRSPKHGLYLGSIEGGILISHGESAALGGAHYLLQREGVE